MKKLVLFFVFMAVFTIELFAQGAGKTMDFDGTDDYVEVTGILETNMDVLTLSAWVNFNTTNTPGGYGIITKYDYPANINSDFYFGLIAGSSGTDPNFQFSGTDDGTVPDIFTVGSPAISQFPSLFGFSIEINTWYFIAATYDRAVTTAKIYVNGIDVTVNSTIPDLPIHGSTQPVWFGRIISDQRWLDGKIDEVCIWDAALTQDQIRDIMCRKLTQSYVDGMSGITWNSNLIAYYRFDESSGTNLPDVGPNSYDGTWYGSGGGSHTSPAWETSGAALGDASTQDYTSPSSVNLASSYGDDVTVGTITGSPDGVQIYRVDSAPNVTTPPAGLDQLSQSHYFGTYIVGGTDPTYTLTYNYEGHPGISNENNLELASRDNNASSSWTDLDAALNTIDNTLIKTGQTGTEYILASSSVNPLPVNLSSFTATYIDGSSILNWTTQSETNNLGWNVYRGETETAFENNTSIRLNNSGLIPGAGTTTEPTNYQFTDEYDVIVGQTYWYWLEAVEVDGFTTSYGPVGVTIEGEGNAPQLPTATYLNSNYPNPFNPSTKIELSVKEGENGIFTIYNSKGQILETHKYEAGEYDYNWNASQYGSGIYFYKLESQSYTETKKMIMLK
ncbi:MAG: T9SS type A sorting domain-containing protein [Bacteroidales bacterium]|nr:T9SS type A sorting domain-containing protein [Bacteroidales bacterium]